ncbi:hypothetical protein SK128_002950 [Halocaridina rubra]|uniref:Uncharacterized protein n=1 Tax=Halocaridina rubra TaxID=373956 RepID=A0AAN8WWL2_HALRR
MESVRVQRANLEAMTAKIRLPPLAPGVGGKRNILTPPDVAGISSGSSSSSLNYGCNKWQTRRRKGLERPPSGTRGSSTSYKIGTGVTPRLPTLDLPPMALASTSSTTVHDIRKFKRPN